MSVEVNLPIILLASLIVAASPGPATLAIAGTAMRSGRKQSLALASGITTGSLFWSCAAAFGLGAVMLTHAWVLEIIRYCGRCRAASARFLARALRCI
jgi:threonine efflux protein